MRELAESILEWLPDNGEKISGGNIRDKFSLSRKEWTEVKTYLSDAGVIELGRGRGGTVKKLDDELPPEPKKLTKEEMAAIAREAKEERSRAQKQRDGIRQSALELGQEKFQDATKIEVQVWNVDTGKCYLTVWKEKEAKIYEVYV